MGTKAKPDKRKVIKWKTVLNCVKAQCTLKETAAISDVCENTLRERCLEENGIPLIEFVESARTAGLASLRRRLFKMANGDNFPALKFALGNYLKMYEKNELVVAAKYTEYTDEEREMLRRLAIEKAQSELEQARVKVPKVPKVPAVDESDADILNPEYPVSNGPVGIEHEQAVVVPNPYASPHTEIPGLAYLEYDGMGDLELDDQEKIQ
jgi:hypothetical protein